MQALLRIFRTRQSIKTEPFEELLPIRISVFSYASLIRKRNAFFMQRISVKKHCRNVPLHAPISHPYPPVCCGIQPSRVFLCGRRTIFLRFSQRFPQSLLKPFLSQKTWKAGIFVGPSPDDLSKQKHPCWGAFVLEAPPGIGPGIKVLQTSALPLGYGALSRIQKNVCFIYKKNERGVHSFFLMERYTGLEPATSTLARLRSTR